MAEKKKSKAKKVSVSTKPTETKQAPAAPEITQPEPRPNVLDYAEATVSLIFGWLKRHKKAVAILAAVAIIALGIGAWVIMADRAELTNDEMVVRVSRELDISGDPNPAILTVTDEQKVSQPFLEDAKNGDKVLLYYKSGKSVLFRPSEDRIIRQGTYTVPDAKVFIRSGTSDGSKAGAAEEKLGQIKGIDIASRDKSTKTDYQKTIVVDVTDRYDEKAAEIAKALGAEQVRLPRGETIPDADILVIVGAE